MVGIFSWDNLSVKQKLFGLVLLPIMLLLILAGQHVHRLSTQAKDLHRAQVFTDYIDLVSQLYNLPNMQEISDKSEETHRLVRELKHRNSAIFGNDPEILNLLTSFEEASVSLYLASDGEEQSEAIEWRSDIYQQILLSLDQIYFSNISHETNNDLSSILHLEWLIYWSTKEHRLSQYLIESIEKKQYYDTVIRDDIQSLVQNQQLLIERFVALNANRQQVDLLIDTFSDDVFRISQEFRTSLLQPQELQALTPQQISLGLSALNKRMTLIHDIDKHIVLQLQTRISESISDTTQHRLIFIAAVMLITVLVISLTIRLMRKVTGNLDLVLEFLSHESYVADSPLSGLIKGKDELSKFAQEVDKLSYEREQTKQKLTQAKEDAERAKDEAIEASKAKSSFLANMSHEIRTPLNGVIGISEVLSDTPLTAVQRDYVDTIETSSQLLLSLINDVLDFSKIESGMLMISPNSSCVRESIYDIASIVCPKAKEKGIDIKVNISPNTPYHIVVDDHRLHQIIMNFMSNAVKFTEKGYVELSVFTHALTEATAVIEFSVEDSGIGINEQQQKSIFAPFAQEDNSTTRQFGGTGLGLAISTQLVELMGGHIKLKSKKGHGSRFYFHLTVPVSQQNFNPHHTLNQNQIWLVCDNYEMENKLRNELNVYHVDVRESVNNLRELPTWINDKENIIIIYVETEPNAAIATSDYMRSFENKNIRVCLIKHMHSKQFDFGKNVSAIVTQPLLGQRFLKALNLCEASFSTQGEIHTTSHQSPTLHNILIVDDNTVNQKIAGLHVTKAGYSFDCAENGAEAIEMFKKNRYRLILMDCMMPVMDGFEATKIIRQIEESEQRAFRIPIIALTASVVDDDIQKCFEVGMNDCIPKPFKADLLKAKLDKALGLRFQTDPLNEVHSLKINASQKSGSEPQPIIRPSVDPIAIRAERILLVEDNRVNQKVASLLLDKAGYQYEIAENGQIAVEMFQRDTDFDIILMDCMMPVMDGFEATRKIRAYEMSKGLEKTPIIALTASVVDDDIQRCFDSGMDAYIPKPVKKEKLLHQIENMI
ncbi:response regulator [Vibrio sp. YIC-376]|uniref:response regulator n=1 Tax=Vibrio sp. YIC-376 TaxID=3136162 RepID=UPI00402AD3FA